MGVFQLKIRETSQHAVAVFALVGGNRSKRNL